MALDVQDRSLPVMVVDLVLAVTGGTAELPSFPALLRVRLADPGAKRPDQLGAVRPQIGVVAGVRAELVARAMLLARAARLPGHVRMTQMTFVIAARGVVAHVHEEILAKGTSATGAMAHTATHQMRRRPRDLSVMPDLVQVVRFVVSVFVIFVLHVPHSDREVPECSSCCNENVLSTLTKTI